MEHSPLIALLVILVTFSTSSATTATATNEIGFRIELTHVHATRDLTLAQRIRRSKSSSRTGNRVAGMGPVSRAYPSDGEYAIDLGIGTPPQPISGVLDTGSDLVWTQCNTCAPCLSQPLPLYDPLQSSSYSAILCSNKLCKALSPYQCAAPNCFYSYGYGDGTTSRGSLATETFTFSSAKKARLAFGCGLINGGSINNSTGVFGFGRGPLSIVSQLGIGKFSYCLTSPFDNKFSRSPLFFGSLARLSGGSHIKTTPLVTYPPPALPSFYYLSLKGITVGSKFVQSPPVKFSQDGSGGTIIDSGNSILQLHQVLFEGVLTAFQSQTKIPYVNGSSMDAGEICFNSTSGRDPVPKFIFNFEGADMDLPRENYMTYDGGLLCVMAFNGGDSSSIGNTNTVNMHILYDLKNNLLSFEPAKCSKL
ncbi:aspartic proteinase nepenthesin-1-like [Iris pallida]|uniref:Aspartic proteinase nepenthesin-1-like n=1 Tax=Iris pallida TaxID=29817 RepID=A0AAX6FBM7_IRIPA|nr:aspartic proteinase nepenthesin-1-like [Iris pallida]